MLLTGNRKMISLLLKIVVILSAIIGTTLSYIAGRRSFMGGSRVFMFFTTQSNIAIAVISAVGLVLMLGRKSISNILYVIKYVGTVAITLTGVVFVAVLAPALGVNAWNIQNVLTHVVVPLAAVADFFVASIGAEIKKINVLYVLIPPILYAIYAGIGYIKGWQFVEGYNYPYFFLNWGSPADAFGFTKELPFMGCAWWILLLFIFLLVVGFCYLKVLDRLDKRFNKK